MTSIEICSSHLGCDANVCPLDSSINDRTYIKGEKICRKILDYMEGRDTGFNDRILETEAIWQKKYGQGNLERRLEGRQHIRKVFEKVVPEVLLNRVA